MGVYIPNLKMPITCDDCIVPLSKCDFLQRRADDCPLIEIVICGECKHCIIRETKANNLANYCEAHGITVLKTDYCNWGERRADEHTILEEEK